MTNGRKEYWEYAGELLCPRCGVSDTGSKFKVCPDYPTLADAHYLTCERYVYGNDLCDDCERD